MINIKKDCSISGDILRAMMEFLGWHISFYRFEMGSIDLRWLVVKIISLYSNCVATFDIIVYSIRQAGNALIFGRRLPIVIDW